MDEKRQDAGPGLDDAVNISDISYFENGPIPAELLSVLSDSRRDAEEGRVMDFDEAIREICVKYKLHE